MSRYHITPDNKTVPELQNRWGDESPPAGSIPVRLRYDIWALTSTDARRGRQVGPEENPTRGPERTGDPHQSFADFTSLRSLTRPRTGHVLPEPSGDLDKSSVSTSAAWRAARSSSVMRWSLIPPPNGAALRRACSCRRNVQLQRRTRPTRYSENPAPDRDESEAIALRVPRGRRSIRPATRWTFPPPPRYLRPTPHLDVTRHPGLGWCGRWQFCGSRGPVTWRRPVPSGRTAHRCVARAPDRHLHHDLLPVGPCDISTQRDLRPPGEGHRVQDSDSPSLRSGPHATQGLAHSGRGR
jgi:hypothetical protein